MEVSVYSTARPKNGARYFYFLAFCRTQIIIKKRKFTKGVIRICTQRQLKYSQQQANNTRRRRNYMSKKQCAQFTQFWEQISGKQTFTTKCRLLRVMRRRRLIKYYLFVSVSLLSIAWLVGTSHKLRCLRWL